MARRLFLPLAAGDPDASPTVDAVRKRLGGRASTELGAGEIVAVASDQGAARTGVVLFVQGDDLDVWLEGGVVRRTRRSRTVKTSEAGEDLHSIAHAARIFAALFEGQRVCYRHEAGVGEGALVEKCRFGALIERGDGTVLGIGFRRLWSATPIAQN
ncbi:MAG: hypothetical protein ABJE95_03485 [Byssovorax sp.]